MSRSIPRVLLIALLLGVAYGGWRIFVSTRYSARRSISKTNLKQIGQALHQYHEKYGSFPPAYVLGSDEKPWHSWRVLLLPFLGEEDLYAKYRFDEPWDGPHNRKLQSQQPAVYRSALGLSREPNVTTYLGVVSRRTMWPAHFPVRIEDVSDGTSNTIHLVEDINSNAVWTEPRDLRERDALAMLKTGKIPGKDLESERFYILMADGSSRFVSPYINRQLFVALLTPKARRATVNDEGWPKGLLGNKTPTAGKLPEIAPQDQFPGTQMLVAPEEEIEADKTSLYSVTVQIAWDQLRPPEGGPVTTHDAKPIIKLLNSHPFPPEALDGECYFAGVAGLDDRGRQSILEAFSKKFPSASARPIDPLKNDEIRDGGLRVWVYLQKSMPFADVMERFPDPMPFPAKEPLGRVESFGWPSAQGEGDGFPVLQETVVIRDYVSDDDFIIALKTDSPQGDEIFLAKIELDKSLQTTWERVADRLRQRQGAQVIEQLRGIDHLQIPILSFGIKGSLHQLSGARIPMPRHPERFIALAEQTIQFRLDEYGAELIADTQLVVGENGHGPDLKRKKLTPRRFEFDKPFLLALREKDAEVPYFLAWIGNAELMERIK